MFSWTWTWSTVNYADFNSKDLCVKCVAFRNFCILRGGPFWLTYKAWEEQSEAWKSEEVNAGANFNFYADDLRSHPMI